MTLSEVLEYVQLEYFFLVLLFSANLGNCLHIMMEKSYTLLIT